MHTTRLKSSNLYFIKQAWLGGPLRESSGIPRSCGTQGLNFLYTPIHQNYLISSTLFEALLSSSPEFGFGVSTVSFCACANALGLLRSPHMYRWGSPRLLLGAYSIQETETFAIADGTRKREPLEKNPHITLQPGCSSFSKNSIIEQPNQGKPWNPHHL